MNIRKKKYNIINYRKYIYMLNNRYPILCLGTQLKMYIDTYSTTINNLVQMLHFELFYCNVYLNYVLRKFVQPESRVKYNYQIGHHYSSLFINLSHKYLGYYICTILKDNEYNDTN